MVTVASSLLRPGTPPICPVNGDDTDGAVRFCVTWLIALAKSEHGLPACNCAMIVDGLGTLPGDPSTGTIPTTCEPLVTGISASSWLASELSGIEPRTGIEGVSVEPPVTEPRLGAGSELGRNCGFPPATIAPTTGINDRLAALGSDPEIWPSVGATSPGVVGASDSSWLTVDCEDEHAEGNDLAHSVAPPVTNGCIALPSAVKSICPSVRNPEICDGLLAI